MKVKVRIIAEAVHEFDTQDYVEAWQECCDENDHEEGNDYDPVPKAFALEQFQEALETGDLDLSEVLESATIDVREVK